MFNKILLVHRNNLSEEGLNCLKKIQSIFKGKNLLIREHAKFGKKDLDGVDLVLTFGGDGTFIEAANLIEDALIFGINANPKSSEGALANITCDEIDCLKEILDGNFEVIEKQRAEILKNGVLLKEIALNEIYVGAASQFHSSRYVLKYKGKEEEQRSSGVIISTGTGSPAWFKSAGGKEFGPSEKKLSFIVREPYVGKRIFVPKIMKGEILPGEKIVLESKRDSGGILAIGFSTYPFNTGDIVEVRLSDKPSKVISLRRK
jgi:hypothetical protein